MFGWAMRDGAAAHGAASLAGAARGRRAAADPASRSPRSRPPSTPRARPRAARDPPDERDDAPAAARAGELRAERARVRARARTCARSRASTRRGRRGASGSGPSAARARTVARLDGEARVLDERADPFEAFARPPAGARAGAPPPRPSPSCSTRRRCCRRRVSAPRTRTRSIGSPFVNAMHPPRAAHAASMPLGLPWKTRSHAIARSVIVSTVALGSSARAIATPIAAEHPRPPPGGRSTCASIAIGASDPLAFRMSANALPRSDRPARPGLDLERRPRRGEDPRGADREAARAVLERRCLGARPALDADRDRRHAVDDRVLAEEDHLAAGDAWTQLNCLSLPGR